MSRRFTYIYDSYFGWCRGAHPLINRGAKVEMLHIHLFQGVNAHPMADGFGKVALAHDMRVAGLSGQDFDQRYIDQVIQLPTEILDPNFTAWSAALVHDRGARTEIALAHDLQIQRYIDGTSAQNRSAVEAAVMRLGVTANLEDGAKVAARTATKARQRLANMNLGGVPQLIVEENGQRRLLSVAEFYKSPTAVTALAC